VSVREKHLFRLAYGALALVFWVALGAFVIVLVRPNHDRSPDWSKWKPTADGLVGAHEIGLRVASAYKAENGTQLAAVQEHGPQVQGLRLEAIGVRRLNSGGQIDPYIGLFRANNTLIYAFCGLAANCAVTGNSAAEQRMLRREALELSLYSFKYLKGVDQVVSLLQTAKDSGTSAVFLRRSDLQPELHHPLRDTLPLAAPPSATASDPKESAVIDALTLQNTFPAHFEPLPDGDAILVLDVSPSS
jgi:hypothetical protein